MVLDLGVLKFLLREPETDLSNLNELNSKVLKMLGWIHMLDKWSLQLGMSRGKLCRELLPFGLETDARDQANASQDSISTSCLNIPLEDKKNLYEGAYNCRKLLRIKLSDDADILQAIDACNMILDVLRQPNV